MSARVATLLGGGVLLFLILSAPGVSVGQTRFEIAAGTLYGLQQVPVTLAGSCQAVSRSISRSSSSKALGTGA